MSTVYIGTAEAAARAKHHFWPAEADVVKRLRNEAILPDRVCKKRKSCRGRNTKIRAGVECHVIETVTGRVA